MMNSEKAKELSELCNQFRKDVLTVLHEKQTGHPGGSLSVCEILTALYFDRMNVNPSDPSDPNRDRLVLCKGHAAPMLYRNLAEKGFFPVSEMATLRRMGGLAGHPNMHTAGVEMPGGPLGQGFPAAQGMAMALKLNKSPAKVYAVLGDGELNEGVVWETAMSAAKFKLDNLIAIVDYNKVQLDGTTDEVMPLGDLAAKWEAFGWTVLECDGHDLEALDFCISVADGAVGAPTVIITNTVKGKGVSFMEGKNTWHGKAIDNESFAKAMEELGGEVNA